METLTGGEAISNTPIVSSLRGHPRRLPWGEEGGKYATRLLRMTGLWVAKTPYAAITLIF
jgi:hypothetical protein